jgi:serine protease Do
MRSIRTGVKMNAARTATAVGVLALLSGGAAWWSTPEVTLADSIAAPSAGGPAATSYAEAVARVSPAVVTVRVEKRASVAPTGAPMDDPLLRRFFGDRMPQGRVPQDRTPRQRGLGSGVIVTADGRIVTNAHVVEGADRVRVELTDGREFDAKVVGVDAPTDLAVLDVEAADLPTLPLGDSERPRVGDVVLAVGNPLGVGQTVTMGILSAKGRATSVGDGSYEDFLQTDAPINQGNSGGALVTAQGELIGINSQILSPSGGNIGIGFAIPATMARHVVNEIVEHGKVRRGRIGVTIQPVTGDIAKSLGLSEVKGALVNNVEAGGPAAAAGVKAGDVIVKFNGRELDNGNDLRNHVAATAPGTKATITVVRGGKTEDRTVEIAPLSGETLRAGREPGADAEGFGMTVQRLTPQLAAEVNVPRDTDGMLVTDVAPDGRASEAGIRQGDVITQVNGQPVRSAADLRSQLAGAKDKPALVLVQRGEQTFFATLG